MTPINLAHLSNASTWKTDAEVETAIAKIAVDIKAYCLQKKLDQNQDILFLSILGGSLHFAHRLFTYLQDLNFLHDFIQIMPNEVEGVLDWRVIPQTNLSNKHVILLDEILDDGRTFASIIDKLEDWNLSSITTAVLCDKQNAAKVFKADYVAITSPENSHIFGCGMSFLGAWAHLRGLYLVHSN